MKPKDLRKLEKLEKEQNLYAGELHIPDIASGYWYLEGWIDVVRGRSLWSGARTSLSLESLQAYVMGYNDAKGVEP